MLTKLQSWLQTRWENVSETLAYPSKEEGAFFAVVLWFLGLCFLTGRLRFYYPPTQIPNPVPIVLMEWLAFITPLQPYIYGGFLIAVGYGFWRSAMDTEEEPEDE